MIWVTSIKRILCDFCKVINPNKFNVLDEIIINSGLPCERERSGQAPQGSPAQEELLRHKVHAGKVKKSVIFQTPDFVEQLI